MKEVPLTGYTDRLSARPGEEIEFKVSSTGGGRYRARLARSICADPNPAGAGITEEDASAWFAPRELPARHQPFFPGSYGYSDAAITLPAQGRRHPQRHDPSHASQRARSGGAVPAGL